MIYVVALALLGGLIAFLLLYLKEREERKARAEEAAKLKARFSGVLDADKEHARILRATTQERVQLNELEGKISILQEEFKALDEEANLIAFGYYKPHFAFADSERYQNRLDEILEGQKTMLKEKKAAVCDTEWRAAGSKADGKKMVNDVLKLMLRGFNGECEAAISKVKYNNVKVMETRINKAFESVNNMGTTLQCRIVQAYLNLKLQELYLSHEYEEKIQAEKEEQRRIREQIREEEIAQREIERARKDAEDEERRYETALKKAREEAEKAVGAKQDALAQQVAELEKKLAEAHENKERALKVYPIRWTEKGVS